MKSLFMIIGLLFCCHITFATRMAGLEKYRRVTNQNELKAIETIIQSGTVTALKLAATENFIENNAAQRFQVEDVKYVSKFLKSEENTTSYFVLVRTMDQFYNDVKVKVGFVIDQDNVSNRLSMKAYKIGA